MAKAKNELIEVRRVVTRYTAFSKRKEIIITLLYSINYRKLSVSLLVF